MAIGDGECRQLTRGLPEDTHVQAVTIHPDDPEIVFIGTQDGPYRSTDRGEHWELLGFRDRGVQVWSILVDPKNSRTLYAGTSPVVGSIAARTVAIIGGCSAARGCLRVRMPFACRVMRLAQDAGHPAEIYAVLEVNCVMRSLDDGESWQDMEIGQFSPLHYGRDIRASRHDAHVLYACLSPAAQSTDGALYRSKDFGHSWQRFDHGSKPRLQ